jgi:polyferredoxin
MPIRQLPQVIGLVYALIVVPLIAWLWYQKKFSRKAGLVVLVLSTVFGFLLFAPMAPYQFQLAVLGKQQALPVPIIGVFILLDILWVFSLIAGRVFCGHLCPIGTAQELMYLVPVKKVIVGHKRITVAFRWVFFIAFTLAAIILSLGLVQIFGIHEFFHLDVTSPLFFVFIGLLIVAVVIYRPFCRLVCPFGAFLSLAARWSVFKFKNTDRCINCLKCIRACPTQEAGEAATKDECYMCGRCIEACGDTGGIEYRK